MGRVIHGRPERAPEGPWDVVVVGGGAHGAFTALEAARRGLRPLLLERADFGGGTSRHSLRIVHGGLRYLQSLDLARFRRSVRERRWMLRTFPELVRPLRCVMPLEGRGARRPSVLRAALAANDLLSADRNRGLRPDRRIPPGRVLDAAETADAVPGLRPDEVAGGAEWHDAEMIDSSRLLVEVLRWATGRGAVCLNYVDVRGLLSEGGAVVGVAARDRLRDRPLEYRAPAVVNCAGPAAGRLARRLDRPEPGLFRPSLAFNLLLERRFPADATVAAAPPGPDARIYFVRPWKGLTLAGTYHAPRASDATEAAAEASEVEAFLADLRAALPGFEPRCEDVREVLAGLLPAREAGSAELETSSRIVDHAGHGGPAGLVSVRGVKYTTARRVGEAALRRARAAVGHDLPGLRDGEGPEPRPRLTAREALEGIRSDPGEVRRQVEAMVREEAVTRPADLLERRTEWTLAADDPGEVRSAVRPWVEEALERGGGEA